MALQVDEPLAVDPADLLELERAQVGAARLEALDVVEIACGMDRDALVPELAIELGLGVQRLRPGRREARFR